MSLFGRIAYFGRMALDLFVEAIHSSGGADRSAAAPVVDETAEWPVPPQSPHTAESRALEWHPRPKGQAVREEPLAGSVAQRVRASRRSG